MIHDRVCQAQGLCYAIIALMVAYGRLTCIVGQSRQTPGRPTFLMKARQIASTPFSLQYIIVIW